MNCENYQALSPIEKTIMIGKLVHAMQSDDKLFDIANYVIALGEQKGMFNNVTIMPEFPLDHLVQLQPDGLS